MLGRVTWRSTHIEECAKRTNFFDWGLGEYGFYNSSAWEGLKGMRCRVIGSGERQVWPGKILRA
jgi:hypothetical protein